MRIILFQKLQMISLQVSRSQNKATSIYNIRATSISCLSQNSNLGLLALESQI